MKISQKLLATVAIPAVLIWCIGWYSTYCSEANIRVVIERTALRRATSVTNELERIFQLRIAEWRALAQNRLLQETVRTSNEQFKAMPDPAAYVEQQDRLWQDSPAWEPTPLIEQLLANSLSEEIRIRLETLNQAYGYPVFGEAFVTNAYGANVAQSGRTSDYRQDDEPWWQDARRDGVFIGEAEYDESAGTYSTAICVRVDDSYGEFLGVVKAALNIRDVIDLLDTRSDEPQVEARNQLILLTPNYRVIHVGRANVAPLSDGSTYMQGVTLPASGEPVIRERRDAASGADVLAAYAVSTGFADVPGTRWILVNQYRADEILEPVLSQRGRILGMALAATIFTFGVVGALTYSTLRRITRLASATSKIRLGIYDVDLPTNGSDELANLARSFSEMAASQKRAMHELRAQSRALAESDARTREILETAPDGILTADDKGIVHTINTAGAMMFGYPVHYILGRSITMAMPSACDSFDEQDRLFGRTRGQHLQSNGLRYELEGRRKDGTVFPVRVAVSPPSSSAPFQQMFTVVVQDVTETKRLQLELAQTHKLESIGELAAGIAHEINTPMQFLGDNCRFLEDSFEDLQGVVQCYRQLASEAQREEFRPELLKEIGATVGAADVEYLHAEIPRAIAQSLDGIRHVSTIVKALKEFSHPGAMKKTMVDVNHAIETTVAVARNEWKYVAELECQFDPELPSVFCLPGEINQVFLNLIVNAAHAIADQNRILDRELGKITIRTRVAGSNVEISVADNGGGIPEDIRTKIFDPFFTTKEPGKGTGQGLSVAYNVVVERHNGMIRLDSRVEEGTTFYVAIPINPESESPCDLEEMSVAEE